MNKHKFPKLFTVLLVSFSIFLFLGVNKVLAADNTVVSDTNTQYEEGGSWYPSITAYVHPNWPSIDGATWIWKTNPTENFTNGETVVFKREFDIDGISLGGDLYITADNMFDVKLNGVNIGSGTYWGTVYHFTSEVTTNLIEDSNILEITVTNLTGSSAKSNPAGLIFKLGYSYIPSVLEAPTTLGWNVSSKSTSPGELPVDYKCGSYTNDNTPSHVWTSIGVEGVSYQRQAKAPGSSWWTSPTIYSDTNTDFLWFGNATNGWEGEWNTRVRAFYDGNENSIYDIVEPVSPWSNECEITYDKTRPKVTWNNPTDGYVYEGEIELSATCNEECDYINFWWWKDNQTIDDAVANNQNHRIGDNQISYSWLLDTRNPQHSDGTIGTEMNGSYTLRAAVKDLSGNYNHTEITIFIDNVPPTAEYTYYRNGVKILSSPAYIKDINELTFTANYDDADPSSNLNRDVFVIFRNYDLKAYCGWSQFLYGQGVHLSGTSYSLTTPQSLTSCESTLDEGEYHIRHRVYDNAIRSDAPSYNQHRQYKTLDFVVDRSNPEMSDIKMYINGEESRLAKPGDTLKVTAIVTDPAGVEKVQLWFRNLESTLQLLQTGYMTQEEGDLYSFEFIVPETYSEGETLNENENMNYFIFRTYDDIGNYGYEGRSYFTLYTEPEPIVEEGGDSETEVTPTVNTPSVLGASHEKTDDNNAEVKGTSTTLPTTGASTYITIFAIISALIGLILVVKRDKKQIV